MKTSNDMNCRFDFPTSVQIIAVLVSAVVGLTACAAGDSSTPPETETIQSSTGPPEPSPPAPPSKVRKLKLENPLGVFFFAPERDKGLNLGWTRYIIPWSELEYAAGKIAWSDRFFEFMAPAVNEGITLYPTIKVGSAFWAVRSGKKSRYGQVSSPPDDMTESWNPEFGYSQSFYRFVRSITERYQESIGAIAIDNEMTSRSMWDGGVKKYLHLLRTARKAIHDVDPEIVVTDGGSASPTWGWCIIREMMDGGDHSKEEIMTFFRGYFQDMTTVSEIKRVGNYQDLKRQVYTERIANYYKDQIAILQNLHEVADAANFHYYEDYRYLPVVVSWIRSKLPPGYEEMPLVCNEMGIHNADKEWDKDVDYSIEMVKKCVTGLALKVGPIVWFGSSTNPVTMSMTQEMNKKAYRQRPLQAFQVLTGELGNKYRFDQDLSSGRLYHYRFVNRERESEFLSVVWTEEAVTKTSISFDTEPHDVKAMDIWGVKNVIAIEANQVELSLGTSPRYLRYSLNHEPDSNEIAGQAGETVGG